VPPRSYTDEELHATIEQLTEPAALRAGQDVVMRAAPSLQRVLAAAMADGGYFDSAHEGAARHIASDPDPETRMRALEIMLAEETRLGMLVGVAVGFELARRLEGPADEPADGRAGTGRAGTQSDPDPAQEE
jgi:hypothetical protein